MGRKWSRHGRGQGLGGRCRTRRFRRGPRRGAGRTRSLPLKSRRLAGKRLAQRPTSPMRGYPSPALFEKTDKAFGRFVPPLQQCRAGTPPIPFEDLSFGHCRSMQMCSS